MLKRGLLLSFLFLITLTVSAPWATSQQEAVVPAYNAGPPPKGAKPGKPTTANAAPAASAAPASTTDTVASPDAPRTAVRSVGPPFVAAH